MDEVIAFAVRFWAELTHIFVESGVWLIAGLAMAGLVHGFVPRAWFLRHLGGRGVWPVVKAALLGIPMPLCSCSVIPVAAGLRRQGAGKGASAAFAISTPQTGEESVPLTWALFGPVFAFARPVVAVVTAVIAGVLIGEGVGARDQGSAISQQGEDQTRSFGAKLRESWHHGFVTMLKDLAPWLAVGLVLASLIGAAVPAGWIGEQVGSGIWAKVAMLVVGVPLYICATSSTPLAWSLVAAGLSPGAALVLLLAGPATNVATMSWVLKDLGARALAIYLGVIAAVALACGIAFDAFFADAVVLAIRGEGHAHGGGAWHTVQLVSAAVFAGALVWALVMRVLPRKKAGSCCSTGGAACCGPAVVPASCCSVEKVTALPMAGCCGGAGAEASQVVTGTKPCCCKEKS